MRVSMSGAGGRLGVIAIAAAMVFGVAMAVSQSTASAQQGPTKGCEGEVSSFPTPVFADSSTALTYPLRMTKTIDLAEPLPAGKYAVNTVTYNGDTDRATDQGQHQEIISLAFLDAVGNVLATTAQTDDLEDYVDEATGYFDVGEIELLSEATQVRAELGATEPTSKHSVSPVCVGVVPVEVVNTTTTESQNTTNSPPVDETTTSMSDGPPPSVLPQTTVAVTAPQNTQTTTLPLPTVGVPRFTG